MYVGLEQPLVELTDLQNCLALEWKRSQTELE